MKMVRQRVSLRLPAALTKPIGLGNLQKAYEIIGQWAGEDISNPEGRSRVGMFLALELLPCFSSLRGIHKGKGRRPRYMNALHPEYNPGSPLARSEGQWLVESIDAKRLDKLSVEDACKELREEEFERPQNERRVFVTSRADSTLARLYVQERRRIADGEDDRKQLAATIATFRRKLGLDDNGVVTTPNRGRRMRALRKKVPG